jgi:hypothetical protein
VSAAFAGCVLLALAYFLLLAIALIGDQGLGGPLALPAGLIAVTVACVVIGMGIFAPASAIGAVFCAVFKLPRLAAIPVVTVAAFSLSYLVYWGHFGRFAVDFMPDAFVVLGKFTVFLAIPLGIYWWLTEGTGAVFDALLRWIRGRRRRVSRSKYGCRE